MLSYGLIAAFLAMLCGSVDASIAKYLTRRLGKYKYAISLLGIGIIPMLVYLLIAGVGNLTTEIFLLSIASSIFFGAGYILYYKTLETEQITNASGLGEIQPALLLLFGILILGEGVNAIEILGIISIFFGSFLILVKKGMTLNKLLLPIIIANVLWTVYWIFMNYAISLYGGFSLPILIARASAFIFIAIYCIAFRKIEPERKIHHRISPYLIPFILIMSGILDSFVNIFFGVVVQSNLIAIGSAVVAAGPILIALLGRVIYGDRITNLQKVGLAVAVIGALAISLG